MLRRRFLKIATLVGVLVLSPFKEYGAGLAVPRGSGAVPDWIIEKLKSGARGVLPEGTPFEIVSHPEASGSHYRVAWHYHPRMWRTTDFPYSTESDGFGRTLHYRGRVDK